MAVAFILVALALTAASDNLQGAKAPEPAKDKGKKKKKKKKRPPMIVRGPYIQSTMPGSTTIVWQTDKPATGQVMIGRSTTAERTIKARDKSTFHALKIGELQAGKRYSYRVKVGRKQTSTSSFTSARPEGAPFKFVAFGDFGSGSQNAYMNARSMGRKSIDFVITTGDNIYPNGEDSEFDKGLYRPFGALMRRATFWPSLGNHDYGNDSKIKRNNASAYFKNFVLPGSPANERYYSFEWGGALFLSLDTEVTNFRPGSPQYNWLKSTLEQSDACWKIPYFHRPPYATHSSMYELRSTVVPLFEDYGVKLSFAGHLHNYERMKPLIGGVEDGAGVTYIVTGGGGAKLTQFFFKAPKRTATRGYFYHYMLISINGSRLTAQAIDSSGQVRDTFTLDCSSSSGGVTS